MARSKVEKLPEGARKSLEDWLREHLAGRLSLDQVMDRLDTLLQFNGMAADPPSRSAVGRYAKKFQMVSERVQRAQAFREQLAAQVGPQVADGKGLQVLAMAFETLCYDMMAKIEDDQALDPENLMFFAKSLQAVSSAMKTDADRAARISEEARKEAATKAKVEGKAMGLDEAQVKRIEKAILGVER